MSVSPLPAGFHSITPSITVRHAAEAIEFYKKAFGAVERFRLATPDGFILHAEITIGDSIIMLSEEVPGRESKSPLSSGSVTGSLLIYVEDVEAAFAQAVAAGAKVAVPLENMFWGDRWGRIEDPSGHFWGLAQKIEDVPEAELKQRMAAFIQSEST